MRVLTCQGEARTPLLLVEKEDNTRLPPHQPPAHSVATEPTGNSLWCLYASPLLLRQCGWSVRASLPHLFGNGSLCTVPEYVKNSLEFVMLFQEFLNIQWHREEGFSFKLRHLHRVRCSADSWRGDPVRQKTGWCRRSQISLRI